MVEGLAVKELTKRKNLMDYFLPLNKELKDKYFRAKHSDNSVYLLKELYQAHNGDLYILVESFGFTHDLSGKLVLYHDKETFIGISDDFVEATPEEIEKIKKGERLEKIL